MCIGAAIIFERWFMHAVVGKSIAGLGAFIALSSLAVNPWVGVLYQDYIANYRDVMFTYVGWSLGLGLLLLGLGLVAAQRRQESWTSAAILTATLSLVLIADRALLVVFGLSYWIPDPQIGYRHRPDTVRIRGSRLLPSMDSRLRGMRVAINRHGHHDDDFPTTKPVLELRGLMLGDSVTMGYGIEHDDTMSNQLEAILRGNDGKYTSHQMINTGVEGYSSNHEYAIFRESLVFQPDFATVGFCFNDITDPAIFDAELGGIGRFSGVFHLSNALTGYLANETGFSRLFTWALAPTMLLEERRFTQIYNVQEMVNAPLDKGSFAAGWKLVLENLQMIYRLARERNIEIALLLYPYTFQLFDKSLQNPQRVLLQHAREHGVDAIDLTGAFEAAIRADVHQLLARSKRAQELTEQDLDLLLSFQAKRYFIDEIHPSPIGNRLAAWCLAEYLQQKGLVEMDLPRMRHEQERLLQSQSNVFSFRTSLEPQDVARTAYALFLSDEDIVEIRRVLKYGIVTAQSAKDRAQLFRVLGMIEQARGHGEEAQWALQQAGAQ